jgi:hypothetical protein
VGNPTSRNLDTPERLKSQLFVRIRRIPTELPHSTKLELRKLCRTRTDPDRACTLERPVGTGEAGRRVRAAAWDGAVGTTFKPLGAFRHRRPRQLIRAWHGVTLPLIGGPTRIAAAGRWDPLISVFRIKNHLRTKIAQNK